MAVDSLQLALEAHRRGDLNAAEKAYRDVLAAQPDNPDALALRGVTLDGLKRSDEALASIRRAIELDPKAALFYIHLGNVLCTVKNWAEAADAFRKAAELQPDYPDIYYNLGNALRENGSWPEAEEAYRKAITLNPSHLLARNNLALVFEHQKRLPEAIALLEETVKQSPDYLEGWLNLSCLTEKSNDYERALQTALQARTLAPDQARPWLGMGVALNRMGRDTEALEIYEKLVQLKPDWEEAWDNIGQTYQLLNRLDEAEVAFRRCIACAGQTIADEDSRTVDEEEYGDRHWHLSLVELLKGDLQRGFKRYRARFKTVDGLAREKWPRPLWQGQDLADKRIVVMDEQGYGDCLMMARYLPLLRERGAYVMFYIYPALVPLFKDWDGADQIILHGDRIPDFDYYASVFDLPYGLGTTLKNIPNRVPYLPLLEPDSRTLLTGDGRLKVGIVWAGSPLHKHDSKRSLSLDILKGLFEARNVSFYSLNRDQREGDDEILKRYGVVDLASKIDDFSDSARLIRQMDLVITCDTSTAHLAGGLGVPVWTLLPFAPDWRWMMGRSDTPWYPTMKLFRQQEPRAWDEVIARVRREIEKL